MDPSARPPLRTYLGERAERFVFWLILVNIAVMILETVAPLGKMFGALPAITCIGLFALPAGILASGLAGAISRERRVQTCPHCGRELDQHP